MTAADWYASGSIKPIGKYKVFFKRAGSGEPLICIHGFPSSSWDFDMVWDSLTQHFDVIALDLIGLGKSSKPEQPITVSLQADIIEELLKLEKIDRAHILAHDLGDTVAQELLARMTTNQSTLKWQSCVFLNGGIFPETHQPLLIQKLLLSPLGQIIAQLTSKKRFSENMHRIFSDQHPPSAEFIDETWHLLASNNGRAMIPRLIKYMTERKNNRKRWVDPLVNSIVPIRLINGVEDPISGLHAAKRFEEVIPNADVAKLEGVGHYPHVETPELVLNAFFELHNLLPKT